MPPKIVAYHGNWAMTEGDIAAPVAICSGAKMKITTK